MDEDLIIVDDDGGHHTVPGTHSIAPTTPIVPGIRTSSRLQSSSHAFASHNLQSNPNPLTSSRATRSATSKPKLAPKLKLKLSEKAAAAQASGTSFLGAYDRELDSDDEDLAFEEQFILRIPPGEDCERLRKAVASREIPNDVWFKFKDSRRAVFHIGDSIYSAKLVDLPCVVESQKTLDNKQMFKVADICQMLVVDNRIDSEDTVGQQKTFNIDEFIWPHGVTPPLHHVRKRRFRKRVNRRTIETVEQEVERLLESDQLASQVQYTVLENVNPDLSDSEFIEHDEDPDGQNLAGDGALGSDAGDAPTPGAMGGEDEEDEDAGEDGEGEIDEDLAAELDLALGDEEEEEEEGEGDDSDEEDEDEDDEDDDDDNTQSRRLLNEEIRDLEAAVAKKGHEIASSANPLIRRRFEDALKKLQADLENKLEQRDEMKEQSRLMKAGIVPVREESEPNDDLFGEQDEEEGNDMDLS